MINFIQQNYNSLLGILLYWIPLTLCVFGYTIRTAKNLAKDQKERQKYLAGGPYYHPTDTIGTLIGRAAASICPVANLWAALFDVAPRMFGNFFRFIGKVFDQPLVPRKDKK